MEDEASMKHLIIGLTIVALFTMGCGKKEALKPKETKTPEPTVAAADDSVKHKVLSFDLEGVTEKGAKKWDVKGKSAEAISENEIKLENIVAKAYGEEAEATITADKGIYDKAKNNVRLEKNVKAAIENTQGFAGDFTDFSSQMSSASTSRDAKTDKAKKTKTIITCDGEVQFDYENNQAYFSKNVKVTSEDGNIDADKITIYLDPATKKVKEIVAEGNVKIARGENITYSEKATYIEQEKKILLTGKPKLIIYQESSLEDNFLGK